MHAHARGHHFALLAVAALAFFSSSTHAQRNPNDFTSLGTLNVSSGVLTINTTNGTMSGAATFTGVLATQSDWNTQIAVFDFSSINITSGVTVNITGANPLILLSRADVTIQPSLSLNASSPFAGPGGFAAANNGFQTPGAGPGGGGIASGVALGGGFGGEGGANNNSPGGMSYGNLLRAVIGGSSGGALEGGAGGGGGGAIEIGALGSITVGNISANGGNGLGGGGGAGGGIFLNAGSVLSFGSLQVAGGSASGSGSAGGGGRIALMGVNSYTLGSTMSAGNLSGANAGVVTVGAAVTTIPVDRSVPLDGNVVLSRGLTGPSTTTPTFEAIIRQDLVINAGGTATLGIHQPLNRLNSSGVNITALTVDGAFNTSNFSQSVSMLTGSGTVNLGLGGTLTVGANNASPTFNGTISGDGSLIKTGTGTFTLSGAVNHTGTTTINSGTLEFSGSPTISSNIGGSGNLAVSGGLVALTGNNTYTGTTTVTGGLLLAGSNFAFGNGSTVQLLAGSIDVNGNAVSVAGLNMASGANVALAGGTLTVAGAGNVSGTITGSGTLVKAGSGVLALNNGLSTTANMVINGGTVQVGTVALASGTGTVTVNSGGTLSPLASVNRSIVGIANSTINVNTANVSLGNSASFTGFNHAGTLEVGSNTVDLHSRGFANLGVLTTLSGGTINAANGVSFGNGANFSGSGIVNGKIAAGFGSVIEASGGNLTLGKSADVAGYVSDGELYTNQFVVTIHDKNAAVLGSVTSLGNGGAGGTLVAGNTSSGFLLEQGKNLIGAGHVEGNFKNHGDVIGNGVSLSQRIIFDAPYVVSGNGTFTNTLVLGTFAPGNSPAIINGANQAFGGTVQIELGGLTPGFGPNNHDQINDSAMLFLFPGATLTIDPFSGFVPTVGDTFTAFTWQQGLDGTFTNVVVNSFYAAQGIDFELHYINTAGAGSLTLEAVAVAPVPEPATWMLCAAAFIVALAVRRSRLAHNLTPAR